MTPGCHRATLWMTMPRFILRYQGAGAMPQEDLGRVRGVPGAQIVDQSARMLLVDGVGEALTTAVEALPDWSCSPERIIPLPNPRPRMKPQK